MLLALLAFAIRASGLGNVDLRRMKLVTGKSVPRIKERRLQDLYEVLYPSNPLRTALKFTILELKGIEDIGSSEPVGKISRKLCSGKELESRFESHQNTSTENLRDKTYHFEIIKWLDDSQREGRCRQSQWWTFSMCGGHLRSERCQDYDRLTSNSIATCGETVAARRLGRALFSKPRFQPISFFFQFILSIQNRFHLTEVRRYLCFDSYHYSLVLFPSNRLQKIIDKKWRKIYLVFLRQFAP